MAEGRIHGCVAPSPPGARTLNVVNLGTNVCHTQDGLAQESIRESTHTVVMSDPESLLSISGGAFGNVSGNLTIEHSEDMAMGRVDMRPGQKQGRLGQGAAPSAVAVESSGTIDYDEGLLGRGDDGGGRVGSARHKYDPSASNDEAGEGVSIAAMDRQPVGRQQPSAARYDESKTPSISGSTSISSIGVDSAVSGPNHGRSLQGPASNVPPRPAQPDPLGRTTGSVRLSRPQSIGGLTAEPVFASGSSRSGVTPSISSGDGGGDVRTTSHGGDALGPSILDASALDTASSELYDTYGNINVRQSLDIRGGGRGTMSRSWDNPDSRSGRRAVDSGGASSSRSSRRTSSMGSMSYGAGGVRLRGIEELGSADEVPDGDLDSEVNTEKEVGTSYGDDDDFNRGEMRQPPMAAEQRPGGGRAERGGIESESIRGGRDVKQGARQATSTDSSLAGLRNLKSVSCISSGTAIGSGSRGGLAVTSRYADGASGSSSSGSRSKSVVSEPLSSIRGYVSNSSSSRKHSVRQARSRSDGGSGTDSSYSSSTSSTSQGADTGVGHDLLVGMEMVQEDSSSSSSVDNIMTMDELMAHSISDNISGGSHHGPAGGDFSDDSNGYNDDIAVESGATESGDAVTGDRHSHAGSRTSSSQRGAAGVSAADGPSGLPERLGSRQREISFGRQEGAVVEGGGAPRQLPRTILSSRSPSAADWPSGDSGNSRRTAGRGKDAKSVSAESAAAASTASRPASQLQLRAVPDPRFAVVADSGSHGSIEGDDTLMASPVRSPGETEGDEVAGWRQQNVQLQQNDALPSDHSSPSLSRENLRGRRHLEDALDSPSATLDASTSHLSQSGALGATPVAPGWATISTGVQRERVSPDGLSGSAGGLGSSPGADNQFSRDISEEFIPSQAMQRGLQEQPIFRPLMPNVPTPRASTGALGAVPAFTARGTIGVPASKPSRSPSPPLVSPQSSSQRSFTDPYYHPNEPHQPRPPPEQRSPVVAAAAVSPPPRHAFAATQTDVYAHVVDLDPKSRPGTVKLRTVAMQWGTLNEMSTQVTFDPVSNRLVEASAGLYDTEALPMHLRLQLQAHLLEQQQLYGPFAKRGFGGASGLLQAGTDSLLLGNGTPFSGIGPGFGILSLAFHSVRTAALLEQLERSLTGAATAAGVMPPPAYPLHLMTGTGTTPYYPYGWWPAHPVTAPPPPLQTPGQAAAAAYAAAATAQPPSPPSDATTSPTLPTPQHYAGVSDSDGVAAAAGLPRSSANWPTLTTVASHVAGSGALHPAGTLPLTSPSRLRAMSTSATDISSLRGSATVQRQNSGNIGADVAAAVNAAAHARTSRRSRLSSSDMISGTVMAASGSSRRKRSSSPVLGASTSYPRSAGSTRRSGSDGGGSEGEYTDDFEDVEEESGVTDPDSVEMDTPAEMEDTAATTAGLGEVEELDEAAAGVVEDESIPEEEVGSGSGDGSGDSSGHYSEDFETESVPNQSHPHSRSRTASFPHRSSLVGSSSKGKLNPAMSANSFSGRSLLRRGSVVLPTLAPVVGSEPASREDEEDGSPPQGSRMLSRVGSIIKSSSGFKRTASISITMADDPLLPNQMARILPKTFSANASGSAATGGLGAQASNRQLSVDGAGRGQHASVHHGAAATEALPEATIASAATSAAGDQLLQQQQQPQYAMPPLSTFASYYPYQHIPYGSPYGPPSAPYPPYPPPPVAVTQAANVASVLQYLPPSIPHAYPSYPSPPQPTTAPTSTFGSVPGPHMGTSRSTAGPLAFGGLLRPANAMATSLSQHQHQHLQYPHDHQLHHKLHSHISNQHNVKFADVVAPGDGIRLNDGTTAPPTATTQLLGARDPGANGGFGPHASVAGVVSHSFQSQQREQQHVPKQQQPYVSSSSTLPGGIPTAGSFLAYGGHGVGSSSLFNAQNTLERFGTMLSSGSFPGLDSATVRTIRTDLVKAAAAVSGQVGYEDIVVEAGAIEEYRVQLARVKARLAAARAKMPSVIPIQEKVVLLKTAAGAGAPGAMVSPEHQKTTTAQPPQSTLGSSRIMAVSTTAPGSYRYTTLEDTRRLIDATLPHRAVGAS
ncbi:hypothetical protein Vafri_3173 [Volvox africanus]|uniref:Uncharacterized protein n=1 Tax=Volvox africanus TaxID=51714 RepID=A0A8J4ASY9_9CHLO|nr:hypothetical protein Vafri_3173 [Volvox africanus]